MAGNWLQYLRAQKTSLDHAFCPSVSKATQCGTMENFQSRREWEYLEVGEVMAQTDV
jgi:hypothetical protein